jgi:hypothetical protein
MTVMNPRRRVAARLGGLVLACAAAGLAAAPPIPWQPLFDGAALGTWKPTPFGGAGDVTVVDGALRIAAGVTLSGVTWGGEFPRQGYEIALEARRVEGDDFFCGLTFPVDDGACTLVLGGWGGGVVGLSCIDGADASENATSQHREFERGRWYAVTVRVTPERIECLLDGNRIIDQPLAGRRISVRIEVEDCRPLGIATYATTGEVRNIRWRRLGAEAAAETAPVRTGGNRKGT